MTRFEEFDDFRLSAPGVDWETIFCVAALLAFGTVMVFSATSSSGAGDALAAANTGELKRHLASIGLAGAAALVVYRVPLSFWFRWSGIIGGLCIILLCIVFLPVVGKSVNGARRWIQIAGLSIQASELVKVGALIFAAAFTVKRQEFMHSFSRGFAPIAIPMVVVAFLLMQQPDLGATAVVAAEIMGVLFLGGLSMNIFLSVGAVVIGFVGFMIYMTPWRLSRVLAYLDPWSEDNSEEVSKGWILKADTIPGLVDAINADCSSYGFQIDPAVVENTVTQYNAACAEGVDSEFGRPAHVTFSGAGYGDGADPSFKDRDLNGDSNNLVPIECGPFYAIRLAPVLYTTNGAAKKNGKSQVLDVDGNVIPRLYTAGVDGSITGLVYSIGGQNWGDVLNWGRISGRNAAAEKIAE